MEGIAPVSDVVSAHFSSNSSRIALASAGNGPTQGYFPQDTLKPGRPTRRRDSADCGQPAMDDAHRMDEGQILGGLARLRCSVCHQMTDGGMDQQEGVELLFDQFRAFAAQHDAAMRKAVGGGSFRTMCATTR